MSSASFTCRELRPRVPEERVLSHTQKLLSGWDENCLKEGRVLVGGAGGLGSEVAYALAKHGVGSMLLADPDVVELSNLNRQLFGPEDLDHPKVEALASNLARLTGAGTRIDAHRLYVEDVVALDDSWSIAVVGTDNDQSRFAVADACRSSGRPMVSVGVNAEGQGAQVLVQEAEGDPCLRCLMGYNTPGKAPCGGLPISLPLLQVAGGLAAYAVLSLLMPNLPRSWNFVRLYPHAGEVHSGRRASGSCHECLIRVIRRNQAC